MDFFMGDGQWTFEAFPAMRRVEYYPEPFPSVIYTVILLRKPLYYLINLVLPSVFISFCGVLVFVLPPDSGEKVSMSVTLLLASTVFLLIVSEIMPPQSDVVPLIGNNLR
jgi:drug/metabolite transporter (DMT)-like permease